ncbi:MAG: right-handed parallel beta-helix repeat-containing protein [Deltaproteobacteria bacterium]|nr:right-handed parallel beta-helix repeat-containing protein [Deltaproteobacteria bacterium]
MPGEITLPHPTLRNVSIEWAIEGDDDLDGVVQVRYRTSGDGAWRQGMPLRRVPAGSTEGFDWGNKHSGSIFDLDPGVTYDVELWLEDPDGGCVIETRTVTTRAVPAFDGGNVVAVDPGSLGSALDGAAPGDVIELGPGSYGGFEMYVDGEPGSPIVIRGTEGAEIDGIARIDGRRHVWLQGLTVNGTIRFSDSESVVIRGNTVRSDEDGIASWRRSEDAYIADNVVIGATPWVESALGADGENYGEGILVTGPGHVIEHNRVTGFRDNISFVEGDGGFEQFSLDVIENDIGEAGDDGVEADFCFHNCRIMRNRLTNVFVALSSQPSLGGPTYFIRNVIYNACYIAAFKLHRGSIGDVALHNTIVKSGDALAAVPGRTHDFTFFRNNLVIGGLGDDINGWGSGEGLVVNLPDSGEHSDYDYDGLGSTTGTFEGLIGEARFSSLAELRENTTEVHAVQIDLDVFAAAIPYPADPFPEMDAPDLRLSDGSAAVDAAQPISNVNDGWQGGGPDLGAYELGGSIPDYGPR